jgi:hypothetical protein
VGISWVLVWQDYVIWGHRTSIITQVKNNIVPYLIIVHCVVHQINLFINVLSKLSIVSHIERLLWALCAFFVHNPKNNLDFSKLAKTFAIKGQKLFKNVKKHWINMLNPLKHIMSKYKSRIVKMHLDSTKKQGCSKQRGFAL